MRQLFALHPRSIASANDGDRHTITAPQLAHLYRVPLSRCVTWDERGQLGRRWEDYLHLYVSYQGDYPNLGRFL